MRKNYQEMAAKGLMTFDELAQELRRLEENRSIAERELWALRTYKERIEKLERDKEAVLEAHEAVARVPWKSFRPRSATTSTRCCGSRSRFTPTGTWTWTGRRLWEKDES